MRWLVPLGFAWTAASMPVATAGALEAARYVADRMLPSTPADREERLDAGSPRALVAIDDRRNGDDRRPPVPSDDPVRTTGRSGHASRPDASSNGTDRGDAPFARLVGQAALLGPWIRGVLLLAAVALLVWTAVRLRVRQVSARMKLRFAERLSERERVARDLADSLLQNTQGLVFHFQAAANRFAANDPQREALDHALERADEIVAEGRDRLVQLRLTAAAAVGLPRVIRELGAVATVGSATFDLVVEGRERALRPDTKEEVRWICGEAIVNAFRHASARAVEVQLIYGENGLRLRVRDDGIGVDEAVATERAMQGRTGLGGMLERARRVGGDLRLWTASGAGTEVELVIPAITAYRDHEPRRRWCRTCLGAVSR